MKPFVTGAAALLILAFNAQGAQKAKTGKMSDGGPTDPQISKIMLNTSNAEIEMAKLAQRNSTNPEVKSFAEKMINEHADNMDKTVDVTSKMKATPSDSPKSAELSMRAREDLNKLKDLKGKEFDKVYMGSQVSMHEQILDELERNLIPSADNKQLRAHLEKTRDKIKDHLKHAQEIQRAL